MEKSSVEDIAESSNKNAFVEEESIESTIEEEIPEFADESTVEEVNSKSNEIENEKEKEKINGDNNTATTTESTQQKLIMVRKKKNSNRILVSQSKKPLFFYLNLAKKYINEYNDVELSAMGMAIPTVVKIAEILKRNGLATEKKIMISTVGSNEDEQGRRFPKAKLEIVLGKANESDESTIVKGAHH